jgi:conjugation trbI family protein
LKLKEIIGNLSEVAGRKLKMKKDEEGLAIPDEELDKGMDIKTPEGNKSMLKGEHDTIFGLSKPVVTGIVVFFFLVFGLAFFYAASDDGEHTEKKSARVEDIADSARVQGGSTSRLSDDYGALERANASRNRQQQDPHKNADIPQEQYPNGVPPQSTEGIQAIPQQPGYSGYADVPRTSVVMPPPGGAYSQNYALPSQDQARIEEERAAADRFKEQLRSAIAFAFDGGGKSSDTGASGGDPAAAGDGSASGRVINTAQRSSSPTYSEPSERTVMAGTLIPAMLLTGINTDAPGPVIAQVMADVYDVNGLNLIIPAGSRVLGTIGKVEGGSGSRNVSSRIGLSFDTVVLPNGGSWNIGNAMMAVDGVGYSGVQGKLHRHTGSNFMKGLFNSALTALSTVAVDRVTLDSSAFTALTETQAPTATVAPGYTFNIYVTQNIAF